MIDGVIQNNDVDSGGYDYVDLQAGVVTTYESRGLACLASAHIQVQNPRNKSPCNTIPFLIYHAIFANNEAGHLDRFLIFLNVRRCTKSG